MTERSNIAPLVDDLGLLHAQIAELQTKASPIEQQLKAMGDGAYEGDFYRVTINTHERKTLDTKAAKRKLSPQFVRAHTKITPVTTLTVKGRNAIDVTTEGGE